ncbi:MAG: hypothetical protein MRZ35_05385 [Firmicutes bacterium]|nr:hypothetical protein [Bacillota bacterium]
MKIMTAISIILIDALLALLAFNFPIPFFLSIILSNILNLSAHIGSRIRAYKLGYAICKPVEEKVLHGVFIISSVLPVINVIFASINYFMAFTDNENKFLIYNPNRLVPYKDAIKEYDPANANKKYKSIQVVENEDEIEYQDINKEEYELSKKMIEAEELVDEIMMNASLSNKEKEELLKELRTKELFNRKLTSKKIKKLIK